MNKFNRLFNTIMEDVNSTPALWRDIRKSIAQGEGLNDEEYEKYDKLADKIYYMMEDWDYDKMEAHGLLRSQRKLWPVSFAWAVISVFKKKGWDENTFKNDEQLEDAVGKAMGEYMEERRNEYYNSPSEYSDEEISDEAIEEKINQKYQLFEDIINANEDKQNVIKNAVKKIIKSNHKTFSEIFEIYDAFMNPRWWKKIGCTITNKQAKFFTDYKKWMNYLIDNEIVASDWQEYDLMENTLRNVGWDDILLMLENQ